VLGEGGIDLERLRSLAPALARAEQGVASAQRRIAAIDAATLHEPLRGEVVGLQRRLADLQRQGLGAGLSAGLGDGLADQLGVGLAERVLNGLGRGPDAD
jgi:hypothetical protein